MGYSWKRVRLSLKKFRNQQDFELKQAELNTLIQLHKQGYLDLYFADESHFGLMPNVPYAWQHKNEPILLPSKKAARLTTFGLMTIDCKANFHTCLGSLDSTQLIHYMDHFCQTITKKTIVVLDNAPTHRSKLFKAKIGQWVEQDLYISFFLLIRRNSTKLKSYGDLSNTNGCHSRLLSLWRVFIQTSNIY